MVVCFRASWYLFFGAPKQGQTTPRCHTRCWCQVLCGGAPVPHPKREMSCVTGRFAIFSVFFFRGTTKEKTLKRHGANSCNHQGWSLILFFSFFFVFQISSLLTPMCVFFCVFVPITYQLIPRFSYLRCLVFSQLGCRCHPMVRGRRNANLRMDIEERMPLGDVLEGR